MWTKVKFDPEEDEFDGGHEWPELQSARIQFVSLGLRNLIKPGGYPAVSQVPNDCYNFPDRRKRELVAESWKTRMMTTMKKVKK